MFHWQNLNDSASPKWGGGIRHGRAWWGPLAWEWAFLLGKPCHLAVGQRRFSIALVLFSIYLRFGEWGGHKEFRLAVHDGGIWLNLWHDPMDGWSRQQPFIERTHCFHFVDFLLGKHKHTLVEHSTHDVVIPMPEGVYRAKVTKQTRTWKRPRWFARTRRECDIEIPGGIPFQGKGENGWDCGDDGLCGTGCAGHDLAKAVATVVESVLNSRHRYGRTNRVREAEGKLVPLNAAVKA